ncbi:hypothetical protein [Flavobacterium nitratireducens]|nr:hypothetical protein [Flavobacterium nitratireducens]
MTLQEAQNVFRKNVAFGVKPENILDEVAIVSKKENHFKIVFWIT